MFSSFWNVLASMVKTLHFQCRGPGSSLGGTKKSHLPHGAVKKKVPLILQCSQKKMFFPLMFSTTLLDGIIVPSSKIRKLVIERLKQHVYSQEPAWHNWNLNGDQPTPAPELLTTPSLPVPLPPTRQSLPPYDSGWQEQWCRHQTGATTSAHTALRFYSLEIGKRGWGNSLNHTALLSQAWE